jgi:hypothetical protein
MHEYMPKRDHVRWAKEEIMSGIDKHFTELAAHYESSLDDEIELLKQRNRVAAFLGLPKRGMY